MSHQSANVLIQAIDHSGIGRHTEVFPILLLRVQRAPGGDMIGPPRGEITQIRTDRLIVEQQVKDRDNKLHRINNELKISRPKRK